VYRRCYPRENAVKSGVKYDPWPNRARFLLRGRLPEQAGQTKPNFSVQPANSLKAIFVWQFEVWIPTTRSKIIKYNVNNMKVIITGATGMVGEGVLLECLHNPIVSDILIISRRHYELQHAKLKELIVPDFFQLNQFAEQVKNYDACFFCAGISSVGMKEDKYTRITYDTTLAFAKTLLTVNNNMVFTYVSGSHTDSSEKGKLMWARVKGRTENELSRLSFKAVYHFRPGLMLPFPGQKNWNRFYKFIGRVIKLFVPTKVLDIQEVGRAMINAVQIGYSKQILEIGDIKALAGK